MKHEWRKHDRLYSIKAQPVVVEVPGCNYLMISGKGNPNLEDFSERVGVLFACAYGVKGWYKSHCAVDSEYDDYTVYPLEGVWDTSMPDDPLNKDNFIYTIMIKVPDFVDSIMVEQSMVKTKEQKPNDLLDQVKFGSLSDGLNVAMLHVGAFDDEPATFKIMDAYCQSNNLVRIEHSHREIYLSDARKTPDYKRKTIIRFKVAING